MSLNSEKWVVLGGGYGGLAFASRWAHHHKELAKRLSKIPSLHLLSSSLHSDCTCELYRSLRTGHQETFDIPKLFQGKSVTVKEARVFEIDPVSKTLGIRSEVRETMSYDRLILATGAGRLNRDLSGLETLVSAQNPLEPRVFHARSNKQVSELRMALKRIHWNDKPTKEESFVVVIGGGATGIEIAGEIAAMRARNPAKRVIVVEASYASLKPALGAVAYKLLREQMKKIGIEFFEGSGAKRVDESHVFLDNGQMIPWNLIVVAQGSLPDKQLYKNLGEVWSQGGERIRVERDFHIQDWPKHYAIGDLADYPWADQQLPKTAQVAGQQGVFLADLLAHELLGESMDATFRWQNWGYLVSLGATHGAGKIGPLPFPVVWGPAVDIAKRGARLRFDTQVSTGLKLAP